MLDLVDWLFGFSRQHEDWPWVAQTACGGCKCVHRAARRERPGRWWRLRSDGVTESRKQAEAQHTAHCTDRPRFKSKAKSKAKSRPKASQKQAKTGLSGK
jgi:hypothetical protein